jgi:hypothetical protein
MLSVAKNPMVIEIIDLFIFGSFSSFASAGIRREAPCRRLIFWTSTGV